jgi:ribulose 1,5-bisphosphate carboxylase large subunit-like protein
LPLVGNSQSLFNMQTKGSRAGAHANRVATAAIASGKTLDEAVRICRELPEAMESWGKVKFGGSG